MSGRCVRAKVGRCGSTSLSKFAIGAQTAASLISAAPVFERGVEPASLSAEEKSGDVLDDWKLAARVQVAEKFDKLVEGYSTEGVGLVNPAHFQGFLSNTVAILCEAFNSKRKLISWAGLYMTTDTHSGSVADKVINVNLATNPAAKPLTDGHHELSLVLGQGGPAKQSLPQPRGLCSMTQRFAKTLLAPDVHLLSEQDHIFCDPQTRSEVCVPIISKNSQHVLGVLDIDSHVKAAFDEVDAVMLRNICDKIAIYYDNLALREKSLNPSSPAPLQVTQQLPPQAQVQPVASWQFNQQAAPPMYYARPGNGSCSYCPRQQQRRFQQQFQQR